MWPFPPSTSEQRLKAIDARLAEIAVRLVRIEAALGRIENDRRVTQNWEKLLSNKLDTLTGKLTQLTDAGDGMKTLLTTLADEIRASRGDDAALDAVLAKMDAKKEEWAKAVLDNTPFVPGGGTTPTP